MTAYYNEIDPFAAAWLRELIKAGHIAPGDVDERSIEDVVPSDLVGYTQCHFFAGIGCFSYALRQAGWPDDRHIWTGSCPCQPFSAAGKGGGTADERHLWPAFEWLIRQCRPECVIGEQVESAIKHDWLDHVALQLEAIGYAVGATGFPACSVGAPHLRQRLYWVAESGCSRSYQGTSRRNSAEKSERFKQVRFGVKGCSPTGLVADAEHSERRAEHAVYAGAHGRDGLGRCCHPGELGDSEDDGRKHTVHDAQCGVSTQRAGATNGFWADAEWIWCRDGKWRATEPGTFPLAHGAPARVGRLRGYGNAIVAPAATEFIRAVMGCIGGEETA